MEFQKKFIKKNLLLGLIAVLFSFSSNAQQQVVGAIDGVFDVSDLGGANYTVPIKVPEGLNGVQPNLSLNYSSQSGNGILGIGWSVLGASAITRIGENIYNDNKTSGVSIDNSDKFALDGQRLLLSSSTGGGSLWVSGVFICH